MSIQKSLYNCFYINIYYFIMIFNVILSLNIAQSSFKQQLAESTFRWWELCLYLYIKYQYWCTYNDVLISLYIQYTFTQWNSLSQKQAYFYSFFISHKNMYYFKELVTWSEWMFVCVFKSKTQCVYACKQHLRDISISIEFKKKKQAPIFHPLIKHTVLVFLDMTSNLGLYS